ncbi:Tetratricopeptide repeat domain protein [Bacillus cereus AH1271]|uniref:SIR2 family protein n=1 Tax=Bacillus paramobilis TaxID=2817477 RepID=UPI0001A12063|nr:Tetratricopeptide repeat domain protein [Bacillus cereus AH1271]
MVIRKVNIDEAVREMVCATEEKENPFFFIVGAGISSDSVPLAGEIITRCKEKINAQDEDKGISGGSGAEEYSNWLQRAFPHSISRQNFFRELIENKNITNANFKLAHLLSAGNLANIVVTPNFDDFLSRALTLFNIKHIVCDHPGTSFKINVERTDTQIVHVHGTYLSYDCCNLTSEINERNQVSNITNQTMASLFDRIADTRSPVVVGYSGWENDVIMTSLKKRLEARLPYNLYWFCYSHDSYENLPEWLQHHNDVVFIVPNEKKPDDVSLEEQLQKNKVLDASVVFDKLISGLDLPEPEITSDPIQFFIKYIGGNESVSNDAFFLNHVVEKLKKIKDLEAQKSEETADYNFFQTTRQFVRRSQYDKALKLLDSMSIENLKVENRIELIQVLISIILHVDTEQEEKKKEVLFAHELLEKTVQSIEPEKIENILGIITPIYVLEAQLYGELKQFEKALEIINDVMKKIDEHDDVTRKLLLQKAYSTKGQLLRDLKRPQEAIVVYQELIKNLKDENSPEYDQDICNALLKTGIIYSELKDFINEEKVYTEILASYGNLNEKTRALVSFNKIGMHLQKEEFSIALSLLEKFEEEFLDTNDKYVKKLLLSSLENKLMVVNDEIVGYPNSEFVDTCNTIISVCDSLDGDYSDSVCNALSHKAFKLYKEKDYNGAANCFLTAFELEEYNAGINLVYMIRRGEFDYSSGKYTIEELLKEGLDNESAFAIVNKALCLVQGKWDFDYWLKADALIRDMSNLSSEELEDALGWWNEVANLGDVEGDLVIGWLSRHDLIKDPEGQTLKSRLDKAKAKWYVQDFMYGDGVANITAIPTGNIKK